MKRKPSGPKYRNLTARGDSIYYRRQVGKTDDGKPIRRKISTKTADWDEAAAFRDLYEKEKGLSRIPFLPDAMPTFSDFAARYLAESTSHLAPTTRDDRTYLLAPEGRIVTYFGTIRLDELRRRSFVEWWNVEVEGRGKSWKTGKNHLDAISAVLGYAMDCEWIESNPVDDFRATLRRRSRTKAGRAGSDPGRNVHPIEDPEKIHALLEAAARWSSEAHLGVLLMIDAGLRLGEVQGLRWADVEWSEDTSRGLWISETKARGKYRGETKSGRARKVDLSRRLQAALKAWKLRQEPGEERVLPALDQSNFRSRIFEKLCTQIGLEGCTPKHCRDTFASWLLTLTGDLGYVSAQLGHADVQVTARHYARWIPTSLRGKRMEILEDEVPTDLLARLDVTVGLRRSKA